MIAIVLKFYEFCLHLTELSPSPFFTALNSEEQHFIFHNCRTPDVTWRSLLYAFLIEIKLVPINPFKLGL